MCRFSLISQIIAYYFVFLRDFCRHLSCDEFAERTENTKVCNSLCVRSTYRHISTETGKAVLEYIVGRDLSLPGWKRSLIYIYIIKKHSFINRALRNLRKFLFFARGTNEFTFIFINTLCGKSEKCAEYRVKLQVHAI